MQPTPMQLTPFEWALIIGVAGLLVTALIYLAGKILDFVKKDITQVREDLNTEKTERKSEDTIVSQTMKEITAALTKHQVSDAERIGDFLPRREFYIEFGKVEKTLEKVHDRMDDIKKCVMDMDAKSDVKFVRKEECAIKHGAD